MSMLQNEIHEQQHGQKSASTTNECLLHNARFARPCAAAFFVSVQSDPLRKWNEEFTIHVATKKIDKSLRTAQK